MDKVVRILTGLFGVIFTLNGVQWVATPGAAAEGLGMPLLDGMGRSTQAGDFAAFFLTAGFLFLGGAVRSEARWLQAGSLMLGMAALFRTTAWAIHGADLATQFIGVEVVACIAAFLASRQAAN